MRVEAAAIITNTPCVFVEFFPESDLSRELWHQGDDNNDKGVRVTYRDKDEHRYHHISAPEGSVDQLSYCIMCICNFGRFLL